MAMAGDALTERVRAMAREWYGGPDSPFEDDADMMFAVLVDVAAVYVDELDRQKFGRVTHSLTAGPGEQAPPVPLADLVPGGSVEVALLGLRENLDMLRGESGAGTRRP